MSMVAGTICYAEPRAIRTIDSPMTTNSTFRAHADDSDAQGGERAPVVRAALGRRVRAVYLFVLFGLLLLGGVTFMLSTFHKVFYPFGWDDDEGAVWWESAHVTDLRELYHPIQQYPYFVVPYPPVFHAVTWLDARGTGDFLIAGRLVCVFSALGVGCLATGNSGAYQGKRGGVGELALLPA